MIKIKVNSLCGASHVDPRGGGVGSFSDGVIHSDPASAELHSVSTFFSLKHHNSVYDF